MRPVETRVWCEPDTPQWAGLFRSKTNTVPEEADVRRWVKYEGCGVETWQEWAATHAHAAEELRRHLWNGRVPAKTLMWKCPTWESATTLTLQLERPPTPTVQVEPRTDTISEVLTASAADTWSAGVLHTDPGHDPVWGFTQKPVTDVDQFFHRPRHVVVVRAATGTAWRVTVPQQRVHPKRHLHWFGGVPLPGGALLEWKVYGARYRTFESWVPPSWHYKAVGDDWNGSIAHSLYLFKEGHMPLQVLHTLKTNWVFLPHVAQQQLQSYKSIHADEVASLISRFQADHPHVTWDTYVSDWLGVADQILQKEVARQGYNPNEHEASRCFLSCAGPSCHRLESGDCVPAAATNRWPEVGAYVNSRVTGKLYTLERMFLLRPLQPDVPPLHAFVLTYETQWIVLFPSDQPGNPIDLVADQCLDDLCEAILLHISQSDTHQVILGGHATGCALAQWVALTIAGLPRWQEEYAGKNHRTKQVCAVGTGGPHWIEVPQKQTLLTQNFCCWFGSTCTDDAVDPAVIETVQPALHLWTTLAQVCINVYEQTLCIGKWMVFKGQPYLMQVKNRNAWLRAYSAPVGPPADLHDFRTYRRVLLPWARAWASNASSIAQDVAQCRSPFTQLDP